MVRARRVFIILTIFIATLILAVSVGAVAYADATEADFELSDFEQVGGDRYCNGTDGNEATFRVKINEAAYEKIIKVRYDVIKMTSLVDKVTVDDENNVTLSSGQVKISENNVIEKSEITKLPNSSKFAFTVKAKQNCAFVFSVYYYDSEGKESVCYGSRYGENGAGRNNILYCFKIDDSNPSAYYDDVTFDSGYWVFDVLVKGNLNSDTASADSGIKSFAVVKRTSTGEKVIDRVENIGSTQYRYKLKITKEKARYYLDIVDYAGNGTTSKIVEFNDTSYDAGFETAVNNKLTKLKSDEKYSAAFVEKFSKSYDEYYFCIQSSDATEAEIKAKMAVCYDYMAKIANYDKMRENGLSDVTVKNYNTEYFGGDIELINSSSFPVKYGDNAVTTISVAMFDAKAIDKTAEKNALGIKNAKTVYATAINTEIDGKTVVNRCETAAEIKIPTELKKGDAYIVMTVEGETKEYIVCDFVAGNGYTVVYLPYSSGVLNIFTGVKSDLLWLWSLTAIPVIAAAAVIPIIIKKRKNVKSVKKEK